MEYATWKDKLLMHVVKLDLDVENELFEKTPEEERKTMRREIMVWRKADAAMRRVLNTTLPNSFLSSLPDDARNLEQPSMLMLVDVDPVVEDVVLLAVSKDVTKTVAS
ncbi:hypothetical protein JG687_00003911 [Phytophthora cactorum]|uniref:Uncharacterized protein n=1 Tax=Phytophthora cactorum TaxID=29920 RepID=A0A8T1UT33_9STRA|nr:hypothetical protein JG687_00003911 [Phytophthora cactorum]